VQLIEQLKAFVEQHPRLTVITGAGCSTASGIPDYRDSDGSWKRGNQPVQGPDFERHHASRQRYWARSMRAWPAFSVATPNQTHFALTDLQRQHRVDTLITQNVDGLHQRAGTDGVIELHGSLAQVRCLDCGSIYQRDWMQTALEQLNPDFIAYVSELRPDGDAELHSVDYTTLRVPVCPDCNGILKPAVVFFGDNVRQPVVDSCHAAVESCDAVLCVGTSLMVYSSFRFVRHAHRLGKPIAAINLGATRADGLLSLKVAARCDVALPKLLNALTTINAAP